MQLWQLDSFIKEVLRSRRKRAPERGQFCLAAANALLDRGPRGAWFRTDGLGRRWAQPVPDDRIRRRAEVCRPSARTERRCYDHVCALRAGALLRTRLRSALAFAPQQVSVRVLGAPRARGAARIAQETVDQAGVVLGAFTAG